MRRGQSVLQAAQKLAKDKFTRAILETLPAITEDIKKYLDGIMNDAAASDQDVQRILGIRKTITYPLFFSMLYFFL